MKKKIVVIGAGASGLMAAIAAARDESVRVTVLEAGKKPGEKLLRTGNGRCNYTNFGTCKGRYHGQHPEFAEDALSRFSAGDTVAFFKRIGIYPYSQNGWVYPRSEQAVSVLSCLLDECERRHIRLKYHETVIEVKKKGQGFTVLTAGWHYECDAVILSCGTPASLSKDRICPLLKLPVSIEHIPFHPALTYLKAGTDEERKAWAGVRIHGTVSVEGAGPAAKEKRAGQIQFTPKGVSGIEVMNLSSDVEKALHLGRDITLSIDFLPELSMDDLIDFLKDAPPENGHPQLKGLIPGKFVPLILKRTGSGSGEPQKIAGVLKKYRVNVYGTGPEEASQVLGGGIITSAIDGRTMMVKRCPGLFVTGEMLDIDGECGGWNLQFAWSTGVLAGRAAFLFGGVQHL